MDVSHIIDSLNDAQRQAVTASTDHTLILAGAGSGKTRVLVHRIAWLLAVENMSPQNIVAVTFTNKAAAEMRGRIEDMINGTLSGMWVGTFHGLAHRLLRSHWAEADLPQGFQILDSDDQFRVVKRIVKGMELDEQLWPPRKIQWYINDRKDEGYRAAQLDSGGDPYQTQLIQVYLAYEQACQRAGLVDFAELLLRSFELFRDKPVILQHYQQRFAHVLVDEFQDTNTLQYSWIKMLAGEFGKVFVVGDDDQSIYGWRGARVENLHHFQKEFCGKNLVRLEQNYRSSGNILSAANALISSNTGRMGKELWSAGEKGELIDLYAAFNELDEAHFVKERIKQWVTDGNSFKECAILYRSNAQSRVFEEVLISSGIAYRVYGGLRFFDRAEIKDALAYLRLMENRSDDSAFERVINTPTRGIGDRSVAMIRDIARGNSITMWEATLSLLSSGQLAARAQNAISGFVNLIDQLQGFAGNFKLAEQVDYVVESSRLIEHYSKDKSEKGQSRIENLQELTNAAKIFEKPQEDEDMTELASFLSHAALEAGESQATDTDDFVQLMTLHSAKGLEFPLVFITGLEEGLFPHSRSLEDNVHLEEERRLCYVGMTRAERKLIVSYAETRRIHGSENYQKASRFIQEIPSESMNEIRPRAQVSHPTMRRPKVNKPQRSTVMMQDDFEFALGQRVQHSKFGEGVVLNFEGEGGSARVQVNFERAGSKWLVLAYANLQSA